MKLNDIDVIKLLPLFMRKDKFNVFLAQYMSDLVKEVSLNIDKFSVFNCIDKLDDEECDLLAWELNIDNYEKSYELDNKHKILKSGLSNKFIACSKLALQQGLEKYSGYESEIEILEWFDSCLTFNHYYLKIKNPGKYDVDGFFKVINNFGRKSSICDGIKCDFEKSNNIYIGSCITISSSKMIDMRCDE